MFPWNVSVSVFKWHIKCGLHSQLSAEDVGVPLMILTCCCCESSCKLVMIVFLCCLYKAYTKGVGCVINLCLPSLAKGTTHCIISANSITFRLYWACWQIIYRVETRETCTTIYYINILLNICRYCIYYYISHTSELT